ncbi:MAG: hypothetical protein ACLQU2_21160, partial [Candidatus Binataceae bacterium]
QQILVQSAQPIHDGGTLQGPHPRFQTAPKGPLFRSQSAKKRSILGRHFANCVTCRPEYEQMYRIRRTIDLAVANRLNPVEVFTELELKGGLETRLFAGFWLAGCGGDV